MTPAQPKLASWHEDIRAHFEQWWAMGTSVADRLLIVDAERRDLPSNLIEAIWENQRSLYRGDRQTFIDRALDDTENGEVFDGGFDEVARMNEVQRAQYTNLIDEVLSRISDLGDIDRNQFEYLYCLARDRIVYNHEWSRPDFKLASNLPN